MSIESRRHQYGTVFLHWQIQELLGNGSGGKTAVFRLKRIDSSRGQSALKVINLIEECGNFDSRPEFLKEEYEAARKECMDKALEEAALDLGASPVRVFFDVTLPLIMPAILSGVMLAFAMSFDDVVISIFVTGPTVNTLPVKIYTKIKTGVTPEINALATLMLAVTVLLLAGASLVGGKRKRNSNGG